MTLTRPATRPSEGQNGSITVMVALLMPILVLMILLIMDIGQLIFERVRLQNTADACAYSAATVQAAGLNEIADLNLSAEIEYGKLLVIMAKTAAAPFTSQEDGQNATRFYQKVFDNIRKYQDNANKDYAKKALEIAKKVKKANLDDQGIKGTTISSINPKSKDGSAGKLMEYRKETGEVVYFVCVPVPLPIPPRPATTWNDGTAGDASYEGLHDGSTPTTMVYIAPAPGSGTVTYKIAKKSNPVTYSAFELSQASHDLILAPTIFGRADKLTAYAAAMPTGGDVEWGVPTYRPVMVRLEKLTNPKPSAKNLSKVLH